MTRTWPILAFTAFLAVTAGPGAGAAGGEKAKTPLPKPDPELLVNAAADALPAGLRFHSSLPVASRRQVVEDLRWLWGLGTLRDARKLAFLLHADEDAAVTGRDLVTWFLNRAMLVGGPGRCSVFGPGILTAPGGRLAFEAIAQSKGEAACSTDGLKGLQGRYTTTPGRYGGSFQYAFNFDGVVLPAFDKYDGILTINTAVHATGNTDLASRIARLRTLFHEAGHTEDFAHHAPCKPGSRMDRALSSHGDGDEGRPVYLWNWDEGVDCASAERDPIILEAFLGQALADHCRACTPEDLVGTYARVVGSFLVVETKTTESVRRDVARAIADRIASLRVRGSRPPPAAWSSGRPDLDHLPPSWTFEAYVRFLDALVSRCRRAGSCDDDWLARIAVSRNFAREVARIMRPHDPVPHALEGAGYESRRPAPKPLLLTQDDARRWIEAAPRAAASGYNVPLRRIIPCAQVGGCTR